MENTIETNIKEEKHELTNEEKHLLLFYGMKTPITIDNEDDIVYDKLDNESIVMIMLNRKWKWNHRRDDEITDLEKLVYYYRNTYINGAVLSIYENRDLDNATSVPFPEVDIDLKTAKQAYIKYDKYLEQQETEKNK